MNSVKRIYMDYAASTPVREEVVAAMLPYWTTYYGNPSSVHRFGQEASRALEEARESVARSLRARPDEIVFTGCGSESDNIALRGAMLAARSAGGGNHLITSIIEHKAVLDTARQLRDLFGFDLTVLPVDEHGQVSLSDVRAAIRPDTVLISIMAANNEIGTVQPIDEIGHLAREQNILFHTDAIQAAAVADWDMSNMSIDLLSLAPHKFYGPKGIGVLYIRSGIDLVSTLTGGGQESGRRAGTVNVPLAVGAARALSIAVDERDQNIAHYRRLTARLIDGMRALFPSDCLLTGHPTNRLPQNASFAFRNISGNELLMHLDVAGVSASSGSACLTGDPKPSKVLQALGLDDDWTRGGLRLTVGRQSSLEEVEFVLDATRAAVEQMKRFENQYT